jgi:2-acylglycerol O-acyltransferase 2
MPQASTLGLSALSLLKWSTSDRYGLEILKLTRFSASSVPLVRQRKKHGLVSHSFLTTSRIFPSGQRNRWPRLFRRSILSALTCSPRCSSTSRPSEFPRKLHSCTHGSTISLLNCEHKKLKTSDESRLAFIRILLVMQLNCSNSPSPTLAQRLSLYAFFLSPFILLLLPWSLIYFNLFFSRELLPLYLIFIYFDFPIASQGGRPFDFIRRNPIYKAAADYFPVSIYRECKTNSNTINEFKQESPTLFVVHPHGIISSSIALNFAISDKAKESIVGGPYRIATVDFNFLYPFLRELALAMGFVSASASSIKSCISKNLSVFLIVGGAAESLYAMNNSSKIILNKRKGFIKLALTQGISLTPVYCFNEVNLYTYIHPGQFIHEVQKSLIRICGFTVPLFYGDFLLFPKRKHLQIVFGESIQLPKIEHPSVDEINQYHEVYVKAIKELYAKYASKFSSENAASAYPPQLEIVE